MASSQPNQAPQEPQDAGHVPITEEFDSAKHTMPDVGPVVIALVLVAIAVAVIAYVFRATPVATGTIDEAYAVDVPDQNTVLATVQLTIKNVTKKALTLRNINVTVRTDQGEFSDDFANVADFDRFFRAFPELQQHSVEGIARELKIPPGAQVTGSVIVSFPITKDSFDKRRSLVASINFYDNRPIEIQR
jgi:hypothetical protein